MLDGEQRRYVETVSTCYDVFARARKNILNLTKIEAGKLELDEIEDIRLHSLTITGSASNLGANLLRDATWKVENACTKDNLGLATDSLGLVLEKTQK